MQTQDRAATGATLDRDTAAMRVGDLFDDCQAESGAGHSPRRGRAVETVEDERHVLVRDTGSTVAHLDASGTYRDLDRTLAGLHLRALSSRFATARSTRSGTPVTVDGSRVGVEAHVTTAPCRALDGGLHDLVEPKVARCDIELFATRQLDELCHQVVIASSSPFTSASNSARSASSSVPGSQAARSSL